MVPFDYDFPEDQHETDAWLLLTAAVIRNAILAAHPQRLKLVSYPDRVLDLIWSADGARQWVEEKFANNYLALKWTHELWGASFSECRRILGTAANLLGTQKHELEGQ